MSILLPRALSRRRLLMAGSAALTAPLFVTSRAVAADDQGILALKPAQGLASIMGAGQAETPVLAYNGRVSGPVLRLRQSERFQANVINGLDEGTTVHWHGIRPPNAMDGVPGLTQASIEPGDSFLYAFTPPDAGTSWYHPHDHTASQMGRGMAGALIVEEPEPPGFVPKIKSQDANRNLRNADPYALPDFAGSWSPRLSHRGPNEITGERDRIYRQVRANGRCHPYGGQVSGHPLDPLRARRPRVERIAEILGLARHLPIEELHDAHRVRRPPVIG
jgi:hypothetical protein